MVSLHELPVLPQDLENFAVAQTAVFLRRPGVIAEPTPPIVGKIEKSRADIAARKWNMPPP